MSDDNQAVARPATFEEVARKISEDKRNPDLFRAPDPIEWRESYKGLKEYPVFKIARLTLPINPLFNRRMGGIPLEELINILHVLPKDTCIIDARYGQGFGQEIEYLVQSAEFPENIEGMMYPRVLLIKRARILSPEDAVEEGATSLFQEYYSGWTIGENHGST